MSAHQDTAGDILAEAHGYRVAMALTGGVVLSLRRGETPLFREAGPACRQSQNPLEAACFPCAPYFGRLADPLRYDGARYAMAANATFCDPQQAIHGHGWIAPWTLRNQTGANLTMDLAHQPRPGAFPFACLIEQTIRIEPDGVVFAMRLTNQDTRTMPAGLAFHPYFDRTAQTRLSLEAQGLWSPPLKQNEAGSYAALPAELDFAARAPLPDRLVDHSLTGFGGVAEIRQGDVSIRLESDAPHSHLFAPEGEQYFCLEPVTQLPGKLSGTALAPGATTRLSMRVSASR